MKQNYLQSAAEIITESSHKYDEFNLEKSGTKNIKGCKEQKGFFVR